MLYFTKIENILQRRTNETIRYSFKLANDLLTTILISTAIILEVENQLIRNSNSDDISSSTGKASAVKIYQFHDMLYYMFVTLSTIGYGDITPKTLVGRFSIIITIFLILIIVPTQSEKLFTILALTTKYSRISYNKFSNETRHLLLLGTCNKEGFEAFLEELYHEDHGNVDFHTVIMQSFPNEDIMNLVKQPQYTNKMFYLVGNSLIHRDLDRCKAASSMCVVLLANKMAKNPRYEDFANILQAFSIKKFAQIYTKKDVRICIQLLQPETKEIYYSSLTNKEETNSKDQIVCVEELKLELLGKSCLCPGINTIVASLITSNKPSIGDGEVLTEETKWLEEYLSGMQNEIYRIKLDADIIQGLKFIKLSSIMYNIYGLITIGVDLIFEGADPFVCLNPSNYIFTPQDHAIYVLADKMPDSTDVNNSIREWLKIEGNAEINSEMAKVVKMRHSSIDNERKHSNKDNLEKTISRKFKKKENNLVSKINFIQTSYPRTGYEAENFSPEILNNHIIVCGIIPNLKNLIMPLRAISMKSQQYPILIIDKEDHISSEIWKDIQYFPDIYFMQGNPIKVKDLNKACVKKAKAVIILSKNQTDDQTHEMVDADTIFIYKAIRHENKNLLIIADLATLSTIGFISNSDETDSQRQGYRLSEQFAVGEIYTSSMLDTLMCQSFYNPYITKILQQLILGSAAFNYSPDLLKKLYERKVTQSTLYLLNIYEELEKFGDKITEKYMKFEVLYNKFVDRNMVPVGIYRNSKSNSNNHTEKEKVDKYVYMCPDKATEVCVEFDKVYVLASEEESSEINKTMYKTKEVSFMNNKNLKLIDKSNDLATKIVDDIKDIVNLHQDSLKSQFSVKKITDLTRLSLRKELVDVYQTNLPGDINNNTKLL